MITSIRTEIIKSNNTESRNQKINDILNTKTDCIICYDSSAYRGNDDPIKEQLGWLTEKIHYRGCAPYEISTEFNVYANNLTDILNGDNLYSLNATLYTKEDLENMIPKMNLDKIFTEIVTYKLGDNFITVRCQNLNRLGSVGKYIEFAYMLEFMNEHKKEGVNLFN